MALLDVFKKKKQGKKIKPKKEIKKETKKVEKPAEVSVEEPKKKKEAKVAPPKPKKTSEIAYRILKGPHVTERATFLAGKNEYVFKVWPRASKKDIKKAVEDVFGVLVLKVRVINVPRKKRRLGRIEGFRKGYKKAIVKIKEGQKIELMPR